MMLIILRLFSIISCFVMVKSSHFYGGTVTWKPLNNTDFNSTTPIMFIQLYRWRQSQTHCDQSYILNQSPKIPMNTDTLQCVTTPSSSCGDYTPVSVNGYCTDFSTLIDSSSSQISDIEYITIGSTFCVAYRGATSPGVQSSVCNSTCYIDNPKWSIGCCVDLTPRPNEIINTPPVATVISPIRVPVDTLFEIIIPVTDADNDTIRCRWAQNTSTFDECGEICGAVLGSILVAENCTLIFNSTGKTAGDFYPVALMVEDYYNESSDTPFSNVSAQFLIQIIAKPPCFSKPTITSDVSTNTIVTAGNSLQFTVKIQSNCPGMSIIDFSRSPPLNMYKSNITFDGTNNISIVTETWIPTNEQIGSQVYCAMATDSASIQSNFYCVSFTVILDETHEQEAGSGSGDGSDDGESTDTIIIPTSYSSIADSSYSTIFLNLGTQSESATTDIITTEESYTTEPTTSATSTSTTDTTITSSTSTTDTTTTSSTSITATTTTTTRTSTSTSKSTSKTTTTSVTKTTTTTISTSSSSTSSTSITTTSTSSTSTTSISTSTSSTESTTTTTAQESVTVTVLIPVSSRDNSGFIGLGIGLGLPLLAAFTGLAIYNCCREQCMSLGSRFRRRFFKGNESGNNNNTNQAIEMNEKFTDYKDDSQNFQNGTRDYRNEYIRIENDDQTNDQSMLKNDERPLTQENSFACVSVSDFELNTLNVTTTSFFSPSMNSLPNNDVQYIKETSVKTNISQPNSSLLVRAYSEQEKNKFVNP